MNIFEQLRREHEQAIAQKAGGFAMGFFHSAAREDFALFERMELNEPTRDLLGVLGRRQRLSMAGFSNKNVAMG